MEEFVFFLTIDYRLEIRVKLEAKTTREVMRKFLKRDLHNSGPSALAMPETGPDHPVWVPSIPRIAALSDNSASEVSRYSLLEKHKSCFWRSCSRIAGHTD